MAGERAAVNDEPLKAPFVWFGGKRKVADKVWQALGDVDHYVEPFAGSHRQPAPRMLVAVATLPRWGRRSPARPVCRRYVVSTPLIEWYTSTNAAGYYVAKYGIRKQVALMHEGGNASTLVAYFRDPGEAVRYCMAHGMKPHVNQRLTCEDTCIAACLGLCGT